MIADPPHANRSVPFIEEDHPMSHMPTMLVAAFYVVAMEVPAIASTLRCPPDSVNVGDVCVDKYEASVWQISPSNRFLIKQVQKGRVTLAALTAGGAVQLGCTSAPFNQVGYPANFPTNGNWTPVAGSDPSSPGVYAVSVAGVLPSTCNTWFQANQACRLSGKRLVRNDEWQAAAQGTPDPGTDDGISDCNIGTAGGPVNSGSRANCKSSWGAFDTVGNVEERVADWADRANVAGCTDWTSQTGIAGGDYSCFGGSGSTAADQIPGTLLRGGAWYNGSITGVFSVNAVLAPSESWYFLGFRCAH
jgi:formylglycine-generating enzyme required for sulfatase activity